MIFAEWELGMMIDSNADYYEFRRMGMLIDSNADFWDDYDFRGGVGTLMKQIKLILTDFFSLRKRLFDGFPQ